MARVKFGKVTRSRRKRWIKRAKGYYGLKKASYKKAHEQVVRSMAYAFIGRKEKKRDFRGLWITRINAAVRPYGLSYSRFMFGLKQANVDVNRKMLSELAISNPEAFENIVHTIQKTLGQATTTSNAKPVKTPTTKKIEEQPKTLKDEPSDKPVAKEQQKQPATTQAKPKTKILAATKDVEAHDYLNQIEAKYSDELAQHEANEKAETEAYEQKISEEIAKIADEEQKKSRKAELEKERLAAKKAKSQMSTEERAKLDGSDSIDEARQELQKHANKLRSLVDEKETDIHEANLRDMTKKELIKYMRSAANKINKKK